MRLVAYEIRRTRVYVVEVSVIETKLWTCGMQYKFALLDRPKIRGFGIFAINFCWLIQIRSDMRKWKEDRSRYYRTNLNFDSYDSETLACSTLIYPVSNVVDLK